MKVSVLDIQVPGPEARPQEFQVPVVLELDGVRETHVFTVKAGLFGPSNVPMVIANPDLEVRFHQDQKSLHQIMHLVGQVLHHGPVMLPQRVAA